MRKKGLGVTLCCLLTLWSTTSLAAATAAYLRGASSPWSSSSNEAAMTTVFGPQGTGWDDLRMSAGGAPFQLSSGYTFIFLEGSDSTANELNAYLTANRAAIEAFVAAGGALLLNSAPNQGGNIDFGFGGVTLQYAAFSSSATAVDASHPVFLGPHGTTGTSFSGNYFAHASVAGPDLTSILTGQAGIILAEKHWGAGLVVVGGMTTDNWHSPKPQSTNLRANIIAYTAAGAFVDADGDGLPNYWEILYGTDPNDASDPHLTVDVDADGLNWLQEFQAGTHPFDSDTDNDNVNDGDEVALGTNPLVRDPRAVLTATQGADIGTVYYQFTVTTNDPTTTGFRVYYGATSGSQPSDYDAFYDVNDPEVREGLIDRRWGLQGVPFVYIRVAPVRDAGGGRVFVGELSNEVSTYFAGEKIVNSAGEEETPEEQLVGNDDDSSDRGALCFVQAVGGGREGADAARPWIALGGLGLAFGIAQLVRRRTARR